MIPPTLSAAVPNSSLPGVGSVPKTDAFEAIARELNTHSPEGMARQLANPAAIGARVAHNLGGWQVKLDQMDQMIGSATNAPETKQPTPSEAIGQALPATAPIFGLMVQTFNFAMQTQLVARAATQFTGSINTLMKGQ